MRLTIYTVYTLYSVHSNSNIRIKAGYKGKQPRRRKKKKHGNLKQISCWIEILRTRFQSYFFSENAISLIIKYLRSLILCCKDMGIGKSEFVTKSH